MLSDGAIFSDLEWPNYKVTLLFNAEYLGNGTRYRHNYNEILIDTYEVMPFLRVSFWITLSDRDIFNDTRYRAVSLQQLSFLVFTTRRICIAQSMLWQDICLSVCPSIHSSVTCRYCV